MDNLDFPFQNEELKQVFQDLPFILFVINTKGEFVLSEGIGLISLGLMPGQVVGQNVFDLYKDNNKIVRELQRALSGETFTSLVHLEDSGLYFETHYTPHFDDRGEIKWVSGIAFDLTDRIQMENNVRLSTKRLENLVEDLQQFSYVLTHDLKRPLMILNHYLSELEVELGTPIPDRIKEYLEICKLSGEQVTELLNELVTYFRLTRAERTCEVLDVKKCLEKATKNLDHEINQTHAEILVKGEFPKLFVCATEITILFQNLLSNGIKFHQETSPHVIVSCNYDEDDESWVFCVEDKGIGFDQRFANRVFKIFQRLNPPDEYPGAGMGLAICKKILENHGGNIWVESKPGIGSKFFFSLSKQLSYSSFNKD